MDWEMKGGEAVGWKAGGRASFLCLRYLVIPYTVSLLSMPIWAASLDFEDDGCTFVSSGKGEQQTSRDSEQQTFLLPEIVHGKLGVVLCSIHTLQNT